MVVYAADEGNHSRSHCHSAGTAGHVCRSQPQWPYAQCHIACRTGFCRRHGAGCGHRRAGKHFPAQGTGRTDRNGRGKRDGPGLGCPPRLNGNDRGHLCACNLSEGRGRSAVCRPCAHDRHCGDFLAAGGCNRVTYTRHALSRFRQDRRHTCRKLGASRASHPGTHGYSQTTSGPDRRPDEHPCHRYLAARTQS